MDPLPSYGRGIELPGGRYTSLINGYMLHDVVVTGMFTSNLILCFICCSLSSISIVNIVKFRQVTMEPSMGRALFGGIGSLLNP